MIHRVPLSQERGIWSVGFPQGSPRWPMRRADRIPLAALIGRRERWLAVAAFLAFLAAAPWHLCGRLARARAVMTPTSWASPSDAPVPSLRATKSSPIRGGQVSLYGSITGNPTS